MTEKRFTDTAKIESTRMTSDGYMVISARCARTGCQTYTANDVGLMGAEPINVYRPEEVVFSKDSLATFAHKPVTVGHPAEPVTAENWKQHAVGDVGDEVARDGEFVRVSLTLMDAAAIQAVKAGTREISMGYSTGIELKDGVAPDGTAYQAVQTGPIKINHLALVDRARGGNELRIGDGAGNWGVCPINDAQKEIPMNTRKIMVDGLEVETTDAGAAAITKLLGDVAAKDTAIADAEAAHKTAIAAKDEEIGTLKGEKKALEDAAMSPEKMRAAVKDRADLEKTVTAIDSKIDLNQSDADLRKAAVAAQLGDDAVKDVSDAELSGMFRAISRDATKKGRDTFRDTAAGGVTQTNDGEGSWAFLDEKKEA